jgi:TonB family protein
MKLRILVASSLLALLAAFAEPAPSAPRAAGWTADWGDHLCTLIRETGGAETLALSRAPGVRSMQLRWINKDWDARSRPRKAQLFLEPGHFRIEDFDGLPLAEDKGVGSDGISYHLLDRLASARSIRLEDGGKLVKEIPLPGAAMAVRGFRECNDSALQEFGVDPAAMAVLRELPKLRVNFKYLVSGINYPEDAARLGISGTSVARLDVDTKGAVERCTIVRSSNDSDLDGATCRALSRARFEPALGADGMPARASTIHRIVWRADDNVKLPGD